MLHQTIYRFRLWILIVLFLASFIAVIAQSYGVTATAVNPVNLRAGTGIDFDRVGELTPNTSYPVIGRSEFFPWLLLGDPVSLSPIGWVFRDLVTVQGDVNTVPFSEQIVDESFLSTPPTQMPSGTAEGSSARLPEVTATPTPQQNFNVAGSVLGEINLRYGPGQQYPRVGVAQAGDRFEITGYHTQFPWVQIRYTPSPNGYAWVLVNLLEIQGNVFTTKAISDAILNLPTLTPTPSVISSSARNSDNTVPLNPQFAGLGERLWQVVLSAGFDPATSRFGALFVMDLQTGEAFTFGNEYAFSGTSINKIAILTRLYASLNQPPDIRTSTDIANTMICSENAATNRLLNIIGNGDEWLGADEVTRMYGQLQLENSYIAAPYTLDPNNPPTPPRPLNLPDTPANSEQANADLTNQLSVEDIGWLLAGIYQCAYNESGPLIDTFSGQIEPRECRQMLHVMSNNNVDALLKAGVPEDTRVAHKHGWIFDTHGNAAVFFTPGGDYIIVMMLHQSEWLNYGESLPVIAEVSRQVYNYYNPNNPQESVREGFIPDATTCNFAGTPLITDLRQPVWDQ